MNRATVFDAYQHYGYRDNGTVGPLTTGAGRVRGDTPIVCEAIGFDAYNLDSTEDKAKTITAGRNDTHNIPVTCYGISAYNSNCMKSNNPHSGIYEAKTSRTLDLNGGNPACNQGGMIVVYDGQSCASNAKTAYTIQASRVDDHHISVVCHSYVATQFAGYKETLPTLRASGGDLGGAAKD